MSDQLELRRHLYEQLRSSRRGRKAMRKQLRLLALMAPGSDPAPGPDDGSAGVREPRRPPPSSGPAVQHF